MTERTYELTELEFADLLYMQPCELEDLLQEIEQAGDDLRDYEHTCFDWELQDAEDMADALNEVRENVLAVLGEV